MSTVTENDLRELKDLISDRFNQVNDRMNERFDQVKEKLNEIKIDVATLKGTVAKNQTNTTDSNTTNVYQHCM